MDVVLNIGLYKKIKIIMDDALNKVQKNEVSGFLCGELNDNNQLILDDILFPVQTVTCASVDRSEESMVELVKRYGQDKCNRIVGHWHIHPFTNNKTGFSSTDKEFQSEYVSLKNGRTFGVFLLSSCTDIIGIVRYKMNYEVKGKIFGDINEENANINIDYGISNSDIIQLRDELKPLLIELKNDVVCSKSNYYGNTSLYDYSSVLYNENNYVAYCFVTDNINKKGINKMSDKFKKKKINLFDEGSGLIRLESTRYMSYEIFIRSIEDSILKDGLPLAIDYTDYENGLYSDNQSKDVFLNSYI